MKRPLLLVAVLAAAGIISPLPWLIAVAIAAIVGVGVLDRGALRRLKKPSLWGILLLLSCLQPFALGLPDASVAGIPYSTASLKAGVSMSLRALVLITLAAFLQGRMRRLPVTPPWSHFGLHGFASTLADAEALLPRLESSLRHSFRRICQERRSGAGRMSVIDTLASVLAAVLQSAPHHSGPNGHPHEGA